ncbi:MAG: glucosylceramidase [Anaerolineae bacterium]|nr:glucosylceramidase [Anaerolineae bacterium]
MKAIITFLLLIAAALACPLALIVTPNDAAVTQLEPVPEPAPIQVGYPDYIPDAAWARPIGLPFENPSHEKVDYPMIDDGPVQGAPLGGFGAGTFSRTYAGDFARWHTSAGTHSYTTIPADMFSVYAQQGDHTVAQALWTGQPESNLKAWQWSYPVGAGAYYALYPRSWFVYDWDALPVELSVEQFSPVLPGDYQVTSYPVALFTWTATNPTDEPVTVGVMFTAQNMNPRGGGQVQAVRTADTPDGRIVGVEMGHTGEFTGDEQTGTLVIAAPEIPGVTVSYRSRFLTNSDGAGIWDDFAADGALENVDDPTPAGKRDRLGGGVAITFDLAPGETISVPMAAAWDFPVMTFGEDDSWYRRYTAFFGRDGDNAWDIALDGLVNANTWRDAIEAWQAPILADESRPLWYKTALFNELYYLADGGTIWEHGMVGEPEPGPDYLGSFAYLECFDYPFYNTFDVDFYASFALLELWPEIELGIMRDFAATIPQEDSRTFVVGWSGESATRKLAGAVPHDLGQPSESPWLSPNAFTWQNVNAWKDLNAKFVLRLYRDVVLLDRPDLVETYWADAVMATDYLAAMDDNGDGIPENDGIPDQTYDTWPATGVSAYSGGLWLGALAAMSDMAAMIGDDAAAADYAAQLNTARAVYEDILWNGEYYDYDETSDASMADQLAGEWYARISGLAVLPDERVDSALNAIYTRNVVAFHNGQMGAVNGINAGGSIVQAEQGEEVWTGTTYMLAAHMLYRGLDDQAWGTAYGIYKHVYETGGLWFRTPEGWAPDGNYRASMYMRPLAIWAMETALDRR